MLVVRLAARTTYRPFFFGFCRIALMGIEPTSCDLANRCSLESFAAVKLRYSRSTELQGLCTGELKMARQVLITLAGPFLHLLFLLVSGDVSISPNSSSFLL